VEDDDRLAFTVRPRLDDAADLPGFDRKTGSPPGSAIFGWISS